MCAIAGIFRIRPSEPEEPEKILASMRRRGPDDEGVCHSGGGFPALTLYHTRLSVIDPASGRQPMLYPAENPRYAIVYNGELYNTGEIRRELVSRGHIFTTRTDTEAVLHAFIAWGENCLDRFNGIFAFAVWDSLEKRLFIARDRMGVKPFFYRWEGGNFLFASELKTLLAFPGVKARLDGYGVAQLMLLGPGRTPGCGVFQGMEELRRKSRAGRPEAERKAQEARRQAEDAAHQAEEAERQADELSRRIEDELLGGKRRKDDQT